MSGVAQARLDRVAAIVEDFMARRDAGEPLDDAAVIASHPDLMPELGERLAAAAHIWQAQRAAERAGRLDDPVDALAMSELDEPLLALSDDGALSNGDSPIVIRGYQIIAEVSRGGQATVYRAIQEATGRVVAIKVLSGGRAATSAARTRFEREIKLLAGLDHPNIVGIIDRGRAGGGAFYLVMEFVDGPTLDEYFRQQRPSAMADVLRVFSKIAKALAEAHRQGIVHRDLKPSNIRIDPHGEPQLLDFGLARVTSDEDTPLSATPTITLPHQIVGSIPWTSPEQAQGEPVDHRADIYSFGFMLYHTIKGDFPFAVGNLVDTLQHITAGDRAPLDSGRPALDALVARCMDRRPEYRYQSVTELMCALGAVDDAPANRWTRRSRRWSLLIGAIVLVTATASAAIRWWPYSREARSTPPHDTPAPRLSNQIGMHLTLVRRGFFMMGSPKGETGRGSDEVQHPVELTNDFYMGQTEVTQRQFSAIMGGVAPAASAPAEERAASGITWQEARDFCRRLGELEHRTYRLPTEAEWEYACRAGSANAFCDENPATTGWFELTATEGVPPVATKNANAWGLYDMHGGVAEWCLTGYAAYPQSPEQNPQLPVFRRVVVRGGNYRSAPSQCRAAARSWAAPDSADALTGFRVVMELP